MHIQYIWLALPSRPNFPLPWPPCSLHPLISPLPFPLSQESSRSYSRSPPFRLACDFGWLYFWSTATQLTVVADFNAVACLHSSLSVISLASTLNPSVFHSLAFPHGHVPAWLCSCFAHSRSFESKIACDSTRLRFWSLMFLLYTVSPCDGFPCACISAYLKSHFDLQNFTIPLWNRIRPNQYSEPKPENLKVNI